MKKIVLLLVLNCIHQLINAQCTCSMQLSASIQNAITNCSNGSITITVNGSLCGSLTLPEIVLTDSATSTVIETQYALQVPGFVLFDNVPTGSYKIVATHPCSQPDSIFQYVPSVIPDPVFNSVSNNVSVHGCNDGSLGIEITGDYCPASTTILCYDTLNPLNTVSFVQTSYCNFCYEAKDLTFGNYKIEVFDTNYQVHHISYACISEPACNFYITANQGRLEPCVNENMVVHLSGDYCLSNIFSVRLYNSTMKLKDSLVNQVLNDSLVHFYNLKAGTYTIVANYANSCTSSVSVNIKKYCPVPVSLMDSTINSYSRNLSWSGYGCLFGYELYHKLKGALQWQKTTLPGATNTNTTLSGLTPGATYVWRVKSMCSGSARSLNSATKSFTMPSSNRELAILNEENVVVKPNPTNSILSVVIDDFTGATTQSLYNEIGELIVKRDNCLSFETYNLSDLPKGIYLLRVDNAQRSILRKIVVF